MEAIHIEEGKLANKTLRTTMGKKMKSAPLRKKDEEESPAMSPVDSDEESSVYDSEVGLEEESQDEEEFEDQGSSDEDEDQLEKQQNADDSDDDVDVSYENKPRKFATKRVSSGTSKFVHTDDLSSDDDDDDGTGNRIGRVPLHWYDEYEHIGYDAHGGKVAKSTAGGDRIDQALALQENLAQGKFIVHDALNDRNVELTKRQLELIRRVQSGAYAHPEHQGNAEYIDYFSGVNPEVSGLNSNKPEPKARFLPSQFEKMQVERLKRLLAEGKINMDYLTGKIRDMNDTHKDKDPNKPFALWRGDEEDLLNTGKGPVHIAAPKNPPPGHAASYIPPDEYLPTEEELKEWESVEAKDRPHGHMIPKRFPNLRSVGAYEHSVREAFERCLDLYLCPRALKKRLNIDPETLVPRLPRAQDLKPFPTTRAIEYETPFRGDTPPMIRCVSSSPDGQFLASGASDGFLRLWEVQTGRLLRSWNLSKLACTSDDDSDGSPKPVVSVEWNPNRSHHCILAAVQNCAIVLATGTAGKDDAELTQALLASAAQGGAIQKGNKVENYVKWETVSEGELQDPVSSADENCGPICVLRTNKEVATVRWQSKGDYFVSVSPKAAAAAVLIHQLSKGNSQKPFNKSKGEAQTACFHPTKPFLFVANQQHVRVYHLVKQAMVKRLATGCRWIASIDVHASGDHLIVSTLDRKVIWFDLDLGTNPYKTLKYHERAVRSSKFHRRYPLLASASDDGAVHVFHSMVYSDLMRNPLIVPVKILRGHTVTSKLGVLTTAFHPSQPWLFTGGADGKIFLFQDL